MEYLEIPCPWCGELLELDLDPEISGTLIEDCAVCCRPCEVRIVRDEWRDPQVRVEKAE